MLKSLDVVIGLTVVLLALSMAVTVITQAITTVINSRGRHLRRGLTDLLQQLDPALNETVEQGGGNRDPDASPGQWFGRAVHRPWAADRRSPASATSFIARSSRSC